ncbi:Ferric uptake regulation protein [Candidatus Electronema halotolerans]
MKCFRMTNQREVILEEIAKYKGHPTADLLYERVRKKLPRISLATVYRNLEILSKAGKIRKLEISGRQKRFDRELEEHNHICCVQCHRIDNIHIAPEQMLASGSEQKTGYKIFGWRVEFFGICPECQEKNAANAKKQKGAVRLNERQLKVLTALKTCGKPCTGRDIAAVTSLEPPQVRCQLSALKKKGLAVSPARCKYKITKAGKIACECKENECDG